MFSVDYKSYFLNGKRVKVEKLRKIIQNNFPECTRFEVKEKKATMPFYKGDYEYFMYYSSDSKMSRMERKRFYITAK
jgi:hypothetical protein